MRQAAITSFSWARALESFAENISAKAAMAKKLRGSDVKGLLLLDVLGRVHTSEALR